MKFAQLLILICIGSETLAEEIQYEKCTPATAKNQGNDYYKKEIKEAHDKLIEQLSTGKLAALVSSKKECQFENKTVPNPLREPTQTDLQCVLEAQEYRHGFRGFTACESAEDPVYPFLKKPNFNLKKNAPCSTSEYVDLMARSLILVSGCVGVDSRELFALYTQESGMHLNAMSFGIAGGVGQLTSPTIRTIQNYEFKHWTDDNTLKAVEAIDHRIMSDPSCTPLREAHKKELFPNDETKPCRYLSFPDNPLFPMLLSVKTYTYYKTQLSEGLNRLKKLQHYTPAQHANILRDLTLYTYNFGTGVFNIFAKYLHDLNPVPTDSEVLLDGFANHLEKNPKHNEPSRHVRLSGNDKETLSKIKDRPNELQNEINDLSDQINQLRKSITKETTKDERKQISASISKIVKSQNKIISEKYRLQEILNDLGSQGALTRLRKIEKEIPGETKCFK